jgi:hypothetical protein
VASAAPIAGIDATALIEGAVTVSDSEVQAATLDSIEQLGIGNYTLIDNTGPHSLSRHQAPLGERIQLGTGAQTVIGSGGDTIIGGNVGAGTQVIDLTGKDRRVTDGPMTAIGGAGPLLIYGGAQDWIVGGGGTVTGAGGQAVNTLIVSDKGDTILGSTGSMSVAGGVGGATITAGTGGTTVEGGKKDVIYNLDSGTLLVEITAHSSFPKSSPSVQGSGAETVNLGAGHGATTLRDVSVAGGTGAFAATTVTGFAASTDRIASATSINPTGSFLGTSATVLGATVLTLVDGSTMTLVGITDVTQLTFTR